MKKKKNRNNNSYYTPSTYLNKYYTKFKKVHLAASGPIVLCQATTVDGVTETFSWNKRSDRDLVKANVLPDAEIYVESNVPDDKGWDYNG